MTSSGGKDVDVSIIIPVRNAVQWLDETFESIYKQDFSGSIEVGWMFCVFGNLSCNNNAMVQILNPYYVLNPPVLPATC